MNETFADLHIHSHYSDSDLSLRDILEETRKASLKCIAITDHDTTAGLKELDILRSLYPDIEVIDGIELTAQKNNREIHLLGYFIDKNSPTLKDALKNIKEIRKERLIKMSLKLKSLGIDIDQEELFLSINDAVPTRLHLALYMTKKKYTSSIWDAFKKYLSYGKPAYVSRFRHSVKKTIRIIKESKGMVFLAHPHFLPSEEWIKEFADLGIDGIEVIYPKYTQQIITHFKNIADKYNLLKGGGSDSHGSFKEFTSIGQIKIPYSWIETIKRHYSKLLSPAN